MDKSVLKILNDLKGKTVVITGAMSVSRDLLKKAFVDAGALVHGAVNAKTDLLVFGRDPGSKYRHAMDHFVATVQGREVIDFFRAQGHYLPDMLHVENARVSWPRIGEPLTEEDIMVMMGRRQDIPKHVSDEDIAFEDRETRQLESLAHRQPENIQNQFLTNPQMAMYASGSVAQALAASLQEQIQRQVEDGLANLLAAVMIQAGVTELSIETIVRETVRQGAYTIEAIHTPHGVTFTLIDNG